VDSLNGLDKLLEAEARAAALIKDAEAEAGSIVSKASEDVRAREKEKLSKLHLEQESALAAFSIKTNQTLKGALDDYREALKALPLDEEALARACRAFMSAGA